MRAEDLHFAFTVTLLASFFAVFCMWLVNIAGAPGLNLFFLFVGAILFVILFTRVEFFFAALGLGAVVQGLRNEDITQGSILGVSTLFKVMFGAVFYFTFAALILSVVPFSGAPGAFWGIAAVLVVVSSFAAYVGGSDGKWLKAIVTVAAGAIFLTFVWQIFAPDGVKRYMGSTVNAIDRDADRRATEIDRGYTVFAAYAITVPAGGYSEELSNQTGRCLIRRPAGSRTGNLPPAWALYKGAHDFVPYIPGKPWTKLVYDGHGLPKSFTIEVQERLAGQCGSW
ncbi:MAG: hypothetical protein WDZ93_01395 [Candidatus Paceibacterota bacterium]